MYIVKSYPITTDTSPNTNQLQTAKLIIIETYVSDTTSRQNDILIPDLTTRLLHSVWNGHTMDYTSASCRWDKTAGTIIINTNHSDRSSTTTVIISRYYMWF